MRRLSLITLVLWGSLSSSGAQVILISTPATVTIPPATVTLGEEIAEFPIVFTTEDSVAYVSFVVHVDPGFLEILEVGIGSGLETYGTEYGDPPVCDIIVYPSGAAASVLFVMDPVYIPPIFGAEFLTLRCEVDASTPSATSILLQQPAGDQLIEVSFSDPFLRGDVDVDGELALADVVGLLGYLFGAGTDPTCPDAADTDDDGALALGDAVLILENLFGSGGDWLRLACAGDDREDALGLCQYDVCP